MSELADKIEAAIERFHDALPQGQGETGDGGEAGRALCQLFYDNSDEILAALRPVPDEAVVEKIAKLICCTRHNDFCRDVGGDLGCKCGCGAMPSPDICIASDAQLALSGITALAEKIAALSRSIEQVRGDEGWLPIETAPKDGRHILAIWFGWSETGSGGEDTHDVIRFDGGEWLTTEFTPAPLPSHWHPLPPPPAIHTGDSDR